MFPPEATPPGSPFVSVPAWRQNMASPKVPVVSEWTCTTHDASCRPLPRNSLRAVGKHQLDKINVAVSGPLHRSHLKCASCPCSPPVRTSRGRRQLVGRGPVGAVLKRLHCDGTENDRKNCHSPRDSYSSSSRDEIIRQGMVPASKGRARTSDLSGCSTTTDVPNAS